MTRQSRSVGGDRACRVSGASGVFSSSAKRNSYRLRLIACTANNR
jgi:hypothetical protein